MKRLRRTLCLMLTLLLLFGVFAIAPITADAITAYGNNYTMEVGETRDIYINYHLDDGQSIKEITWESNEPFNVTVMSYYGTRCTVKANNPTVYSQGAVLHALIYYYYKIGNFTYASSTFADCYVKVNSTAPSKVSGLRCTGKTSSSVSLSWNSVGASGANYSVEYKHGSSDSVYTYTNTSSTYATVSGLSPNSTYYFRVRAYAYGKYGGYSDWLYVVTNSSSSQTQNSNGTRVTATSDKDTIYVGEKIKIKVNVVNGVGSTTFYAGEDNIVSVTKDGVVTGLNEGYAMILISNNGVRTVVSFRVLNKKSNPMTVKVKTVSARVKKTLTFAKNKAFTIAKAKGKVVFQKISGNKKITINKTSGKITVKKGLKKGTYKMKVKVIARGTVAYKRKTVPVTIKVKVK